MSEQFFLFILISKDPLHFSLVICLLHAHFHSKDRLNVKLASFNFVAAVTICSDFGAQENKACHCFHCFPIYLPWSDRTGCHDLSFWIFNFKPAFSLSSFTFIKRLFSSSSLSTIRGKAWIHPPSTNKRLSFLSVLTLRGLMLIDFEVSYSRA